VFVCRSGKSLEPGVILCDGGHGLIGELLDKLYFDASSSLKHFNVGTDGSPYYRYWAVTEASTHFFKIKLLTSTIKVN
jgi:hypothetical protein